VTVQPDGLDPCDVRLAHGDGAVRDLIARRVPLFEFAIKGVLGHHDLNTTEGQLAALDEAAPIVAKIKDTGLRTRYAVNLDRWLGMMDERFVLSRIKAHAGDTRGKQYMTGIERAPEVLPLEVVLRRSCPRIGRREVTIEPPDNSEAVDNRAARTVLRKLRSPGMREL
jgi:DNA primase